MKTKLVLLALCMVCAIQAYSQTSTWFFGTNAGLKFNINNTTSTVSGSGMATNEGCTVVTDANGNVIFYADGKRIWDGWQNTILASNLLGGPSSTQAAVIVPIPTEQCSKFLVFTTPGVENTEYANGLGVVLVKVVGSAPPYAVTVETPQSLLPGDATDAVAEKLACTPDGVGGYWLVAHTYSKNPATSSKSFYAYHITSALGTVTTTPQVVTALSSTTAQTLTASTSNCRVSGADYNAQGQMKINIAGTKLALVLAGSRKIDLFGFNRNTGVITFDKTLTNTSATGNIYGLEYSPNGNLLYVADGYSTNLTGTKNIYQYDITLASPPATVVASATATSTLTYVFNALQVGPNNKIYVSGPGVGNSTLSVINSPNVSGTSCGYSASSVAIAGTNTLGLPTVIAGSTSCSDDTVPPVQPCVCTGTSAIWSSSSTQNSSGVVSGIFTLNSGGRIIKKVRATLISWSTTPSNASCKDYCNLTPYDMGNIVGVTTSLSGFTSTFAPGSSTYTEEITWSTGAPRAINNETVSLAMKFPQLLNLSCCTQNIKYCVRFEFIDVACATCDAVSCTSSGIPARMANPDEEGELMKTNPEAAPLVRDELFSTDKVTIYPNPNGGTFTIQLSGINSAKYQITDINGRVILSGTMQGSTKEISSPLLKPGEYIVKVFDNDQEISKKVIIR